MQRKTKLVLKRNGLMDFTAAIGEQTKNSAKLIIGGANILFITTLIE